MGFYEDRVLPRVIEVACGISELRPHRARAAEGLEGEVLEIGFGSGLNLPYYPASVRKVLAVDPSEEGRRLAAKRLAEFSAPVEFVGLDGAALPLHDASVDHALSTMTLCTIPDVASALREVHRVLRPGGTLHFLEHGRSDEPKVVTWQRRLNPIQQRLFGGCHLDREIDALVAEAHFDIVRLDRFTMRAPKTFATMYLGVAAKAA